MELIPTYGDHMTIEEFKNAIKAGLFTDDDGHGYYADDAHMSNVLAIPSKIREKGIEPGYTHVVWFNK